MRIRLPTCLTAALALSAPATFAHASPSRDGGATIPTSLFASLERLARLVDVSYCVGTTGLSRPFTCASRCREFPSLELVGTWNTGALLSDSCGYVAVDHGVRRRKATGATDREGKGGRTAGPGARRRAGEDRSGERDDDDDDNDDDDPVEGASRAIIVAFRGTYSIANTVVDLSTVPQEYVPYPSPDNGGGDDDGGDNGHSRPPPPRSHECTNCTVHSGFLSSWRQARKLVLPRLAPLRAKYPNYEVHLVGHSLGGAVAALAALEMHVSLGWHDVTVTTFGEPRLGNEGLVGFVDKVFGLVPEEGGDDRPRNPADLAFRRVTHYNDPVPLLPLAEWGYRPHAGEIFVSKPDLPPGPEDVRFCVGGADPACVAGGDDPDGAEKTHDGRRHRRHGGMLDWVRRRLPDRLRWGGRGGDKSRSAEDAAKQAEARLLADRDAEVKVAVAEAMTTGFPSRFKLWQLFFAHRDYFWRLGLCIPGGDPWDWGRDKYRTGEESGAHDDHDEREL